MDPWAQIVTPIQTSRTRTLEGAGKTPKWNMTIEVQVKDPSHEMTLTVYDEDDYSNDLVSVAFN